MNVPHAKLEQFGSAVLEALGVPGEDAQTAARALVFCNLRGVDTHGIRLLPIYARRLQAGGVTKAPKIEIVHDAPAAALLDGDAGLGQVVGTRAMRLAIEKAREVGAAFVTVRNSTHCGAAGYYAMLAVESDMIGVCFSNTAASMAVWGAAGITLGNNPTAIAVPAGRHAPFTLDMATSTSSWQRIYMAAERGEKIADGLVLDPSGKPTNDPNKARGGAILPFGGMKGSGIAIAIDLLSGILSGGAFGTHVGALMKDDDKREQVCTSFAAIRVASFIPVEQFKQRADQLIDEIKACPTADGFDEILMPGEPEHRRMLQRRATGIPLDEATCKSLEAIGETVGVPF